MARLMKLVTFLMLASLSATTGRAADEFIQPVTKPHLEAVERAFAKAINEQGINTAGVAILKGGKVAWTAYFGEQSPGIAASKNTQFNVGSITKTVSTETILRLVEQGKLSLDEPMAPYWIDPDIKDDARHLALIPRMSLTHTTGFPNWRFLTTDYSLSFTSDPGSAYGYSGEGFQYLAKYAENKLGRNFEDLVIENVFQPLQMKGVSFSVRKENFKNIAVAKTEDGEVPGHYCYPGGKYCSAEGEYSAAGNMVITVEAYAKFLMSVMKAEGYSQELEADRNRVQIRRPVKYCEPGSALCPDAQGYGLGWVVVDYQGDKLLWHGGSDWSVVSTTYFYKQSMDGIIIFLNGPNRLAMDVMPELINLLDPGSPIVDQYKLWAARE